jgi:diacylglycerol kinase family enzyme
VLRQATHRDHFRMLARALAGRLDGDHGVVLAQGSCVEVRSDTPRAVQADGDPAGTTPLTVRVRPGGLTVMRA